MHFFATYLIPLLLLASPLSATPLPISSPPPSTPNTLISREPNEYLDHFKNCLKFNPETGKCYDKIHRRDDQSEAPTSTTSTAPTTTPPPTPTTTGFDAVEKRKEKRGDRFHKFIDEVGNSCWGFAAGISGECGELTTPLFSITPLPEATQNYEWGQRLIMLVEKWDDRGYYLIWMRWGEVEMDQRWKRGTYVS